MIRNSVHWRITTLTTVKSVTAATSTVVIFSSRRYPPESKSKIAATRGDSRPDVFLARGQERAPGRDHRSRRRWPWPPRRAGNAMCAAWPTVPSIAAIWACVVSIMISQSQQIHEAPSFGPGQRVKRGQGRLAVRDRVPAQFHLHEYLDDAGDENQPEQREARLGAQPRGVDQLARPHDRCGQDQPGADLADRRGERPGRLADRVGGKRVEIVLVMICVAHAASPP